MASYAQSWIYPKSHPHGKPIFFENGRRVTLERGRKLTLKGVFGKAQHLEDWFNVNGYHEGKPPLSIASHSQKGATGERI